RAEAGDAGLQQDDAQRRVVPLQVVRRPQPGVAGADDADVGVAVPWQRRPQWRVLGEPVGYATVDGTCCGHRPILALAVLVGPERKADRTHDRRKDAMCWQCDNPDRTIEDYFDEVRETIRKHGWMVQYVESDRTPFAYTIGLHDWGLPELLITAVSPQRATRLLNAVARDAVTGGTLTPGQQIKLSAGPLVEIVEMSHPDAHLNF